MLVHMLNIRTICLLAALTGAFWGCYAQDFGPLAVEVAHQEPVSWIFSHMKLVVIIGGAISAAGLVMIVGLSMLDCIVNSSAVVPIDDDFLSQVHDGHQDARGRKRSLAARNNTQLAAAAY